ncbi:serine/threonine protein kinase, partial [Streptomyces sp. NPDC005907]
GVQTAAPAGAAPAGAASAGAAASGAPDAGAPAAPGAGAPAGDPRATPAPDSPDLVKRPAPQAPPAPEAPPAATQAPPEHGSAAEPPGGATPPKPGTPAPVNHLPTMVSGPGLAPPPAAPPGYGHPQQHPQPAAYGYPQNGWGAGPPAGYGPAPAPAPSYGPGPTPPYGPGAVPPQQEPARRGGRSTAALVAVALVVALGAGGSVYALMKDGTDDDGKGPTPVTGGPTTPGPDPSRPSPSVSGSPTSEAPKDGGIPEKYLGTWNGSIDNATGHNTRRLVIRQGKAGDTVLSLTADGPAGGGTYHCVFRAELAKTPTADGPLEIGPSEVVVGEPASSCSPGGSSEVTLLPDGRLRRVITESGQELTYTKGG